MRRLHRDSNDVEIQEGHLVGNAIGLGIVIALPPDPDVVHVVWDDPVLMAGAMFCEVETELLITLGFTPRDADRTPLLRGDCVELVHRGRMLGELIRIDEILGTGIVRTMARDEHVALRELRWHSQGASAQSRRDELARRVADPGPQIDHELTSAPVCPWCGAELTDLYDYGVYKEDDDAEIECPKCERTYRSTCSISYAFTTERINLEAEKRERERVQAEVDREHAELRVLAGNFPPGKRVRVTGRRVRGRQICAPHIVGRTGTVANAEMGRAGTIVVLLDEREVAPGCKMIDTHVALSPLEIEALP